jgi:hypothetical protein
MHCTCQLERPLLADSGPSQNGFSSSLNGTDKLSFAADRIPADYQPTKPLLFSKTQMPVVGKIDNDSPISNDDPG